MIMMMMMMTVSCPTKVKRETLSLTLFRNVLTLDRFNFYDTIKLVG